MSQFMNITLLIVEIWILAGICLGLHWFGRKIGLGPLFVFLGGLTGALQLQRLGWVYINIGDFSFNLDSHVLLPVLLFSILIIYVINGTTIARGILIGMIIITLTTAVFQILLPVHVRLPGGFEVIESASGYAPRILVASIIAFILDLILIILIYQSTSNVRSRFPSKAAGVIALLGALWCDALIFSILAFGTRATIRLDIVTHLLGKSIMGLTLSPLLVFYLQKASRIYPDSSAVAPRPILDFFTTSMQLEAKATHRYRLLRTISEVNKLVVNATETSTLLENACGRISDEHEYSLVCITLRDGNNYFSSKCSEDSGFPKYAFHTNIDSPIKRTFDHPHLQIFDNIKSENNGTNSWEELAAKSSYRSAAVLPMCHAEQVYGALHIYQEKLFTLDKVEVEILDNLADDLAYAIVSLEAREQQAILQTASETMRDGLMIADIDGNILYVNSIVSRIIGIATREICGKHIVDLLPDDQKNWGEEAIKMVNKRGRLSLELNYPRPNGKDLIVSTHSAVVERDEGYPQFIVINMRDITNQREFENQLLNLNRLTTDLSQIQEIGHLMADALTISEEILSSDASLVSIIENEDITKSNTWFNNLTTEFIDAYILGVREYQDDISLKSLEPLKIEDTKHDPFFGENLSYFTKFNVRSLIIFPIIYKDVPIGILMACYEQHQQFKEYRLQLGVILAQILGITIQNTRLFEDEKKQHQLSDALIHAASSLNRSLNLEDVLKRILEQAMSVVPCTAASLMVIENEEVNLIHSRGYDAIPGSRQGLSKSKNWIAIPTFNHLITVKTPILISDTSEYEGWENITGSDWIKCYAGIPLIIDDEVIGILHVDSDRKNSITESMVNILVSFAVQAAIAVQNARLYAKNNERMDEMAALIAATTSLATSLDYKNILQVITEQLTKTFDFQACAVSAYESETDSIRLLVELSPDDWDEEKSWYESVPLNAFPKTRDVLDGNSPCQLRLDDPDIDSAEHEFMIKSDICYLLMVPLVTQDQTIGLIELMDDREDKNITKSQMILIQSLASQAAVAIQNARLYQAEQHQHQLSEALINAAGSLNSSLDLEDVFDEILKQVMEVEPSQAVNIMMIEGEHCYVKRYQGYEDFPEYTKTLKSIKMPLSTPNIKTMMKGDLVLIADTHNDPSWENFPGNEWIRSYVGIPLIIDQDVVGFLNVNSDVPGFFTEESTLRFRSFADHAAIAYRNADLYQQLQEHATELEIRVQNRTAELNAAKENIEGILSSVPEAVFVLDRYNQLVQANQSGETLLKLADESKQDLFSPDFIKSIVEAKSPDPQNLLEVSGRSYQAMASEVQADEKESSGHVIVFQDVTHFKELDQLKTKFVSDVSHELRTPLTNLTLYLGFLDTDLVSGNQRTYLDILKRETKRLTHLIEDLLTFSRIQAGKIGGEIQPIDINQIVQQLTVDRAVLAAKNDIQLEYSPLVEIPQVMGIENALSQALSNLLTNAINYTPPEGKVILQTNVKARNDRNWVIIEVIDNGVGISENEFPHIFERFYRGEASQKTGADGTGLGLSISKDLITRMGGDITMKSELGKGTTFTIWLHPAVL